MKEWLELLENQNIKDLEFGNRCVDDDLEKIEISMNLADAYFQKGEELFLQDKQKAFEYYKLAYQQNHLLAPYMLGIYFEYGLADFIKAPMLAGDFYKEAVNRGDIRGYIQIAELVSDTATKISLWKKFFSNEFFKNGNFYLEDFINYNIDYRIIFLYKFREWSEFENEIREILNIIKESIKNDKFVILETLQNLLQSEDITSSQEEVLNEMINIVELVSNDNEDELFISNEDMTQKLEKLIKKDRKWD
jgi:hypothetical protein